MRPCAACAEKQSPIIMQLARQLGKNFIKGRLHGTKDTSEKVTTSYWFLSCCANILLVPLLLCKHPIGSSIAVTISYWFLYCCDHILLVPLLLYKHPIGSSIAVQTSYWFLYCCTNILLGPVISVNSRGTNRMCSQH